MSKRPPPQSSIGDIEEVTEDYSDEESIYSDDEGDRKPGKIQLRSSVVLMFWILEACAQCYFLFLASTLPEFTSIYHPMHNTFAPPTMLELQAPQPTHSAEITLVSLRQHVNPDHAKPHSARTFMLSLSEAMEPVEQDLLSCPYLQMSTLLAGVFFLFEGWRNFFYFACCPDRSYLDQTALELFLGATLRLALFLSLVWQLLLVSGMMHEASAKNTELGACHTLVRVLALYFAINLIILILTFVIALSACGCNGLVAWLYQEEDSAAMLEGLQQNALRQREQQAKQRQQKAREAERAEAEDEVYVRQLVM
eukprot:g51535.t1